MFLWEDAVLQAFSGERTHNTIVVDLCSDIAPLLLWVQVLSAILLMWSLCAVLTVSGVLPEGSPARTDAKTGILTRAPWIRVPYPCENEYSSSHFISTPRKLRKSWPLLFSVVFLARFPMKNFLNLKKFKTLISEGKTWPVYDWLSATKRVIFIDEKTF